MGVGIDELLDLAEVDESEEVGDSGDVEDDEPAEAEASPVIDVVTDEQEASSAGGGDPESSDQGGPESKLKWEEYQRKASKLLEILNSGAGMDEKIAEFR